MTTTLSSSERKYLRSQAHHLDPLVLVGKSGVTDELIDKVKETLASHELIKVRFLEFKREKKTLTAQIAEKTGSHIAGLIGHVAILYKQHPDPEKRGITLEG